MKQDHHFIKKRVRSMLGLKLLRTATLILRDIEVIHMKKKGQLHQGMESVQNEIGPIYKLFGLAT